VIALVTPDGKARKVAGDLSLPNGMVVTPDNSTLIISESFAERLLAFDIASDGSLSNRRVWAEGLGPDGIKMDARSAPSGSRHVTYAVTPSVTILRKGPFYESVKAEK